MKPGEEVVAAVSHRDHILIFGSYGTILMMKYDDYRQDFFFMVTNLEVPRG